MLLRVESQMPVLLESASFWCCLIKLESEKLPLPSESLQGCVSLGLWFIPLATVPEVASRVDNLARHPSGTRGAFGSSKIL